MEKVSAFFFTPITLLAYPFVFLFSKIAERKRIREEKKRKEDEASTAAINAVKKYRRLIGSKHLTDEDKLFLQTLYVETYREFMEN